MRIAQSAFLCTGVTYLVTFGAVGDCAGKVSCTGGGSVQSRFATGQVVFPPSPLISDGLTDYSMTIVQFNWGGETGFSLLNLDAFFGEEGDAIAFDDIRIAFA